jgi:hypothetical protein
VLRLHNRQPTLITRKIPRSGEVLPAIGLGTYLTFDLLPGAPRNNIRDVMKIFGKVAVECLTPRRSMARARSVWVTLPQAWASMSKCSFVIRSGPLVNF